MQCQIIDTRDHKVVKSDIYNYIFDKQSGFHVRWGHTQAENPRFGFFGPELLDISITNKCVPGNCKYCYQNAKPTNNTEISIEQLEKLLDIIPKTVTTIALGGGSVECHSNFIDVLRLIREHGIVPNYTTSGKLLTDAIVAATASYCGAVAVSYHGDWRVVFDALKEFRAAGMTQTNVHYVLSEHNVDDAIILLKQKNADFNNINAVVFLLYKPQGRASQDGVLQSRDKIAAFIDTARECKSFKVGFDSCSVPMLLKHANSEDIEMLKMLAEPCESALFSYYIDSDLKGYPCSFCKGHIEPIQLGFGKDLNFMNDVWYHPITKQFRRKNMASTLNCAQCNHTEYCGKCVIYPEITRC